MALCCTLHDFSSVRALNIVPTQPAPDPDPGPAHPPDNDCLYWQSLSGVVAKVMQDTAFRRLATKAGEKCGLVARINDAGLKQIVIWVNAD